MRGINIIYSGHEIYVSIIDLLNLNRNIVAYPKEDNIGIASLFGKNHLIWIEKDIEYVGDIYNRGVLWEK